MVLLPGSYNTWKDYAELQADLEANGIAVDFCDVRRIDWFRNGRGLIDPNYWRGTLNPRPTVDWSFLDFLPSWNITGISEDSTKHWNALNDELMERLLP